MKLLLTALVVVGVAIGAGIAYAAIPDSSGVIHGCYQKNVGNLRVIDPASDSCRPSELPLNWSQTGPAGPQGPQGLQGQQGTPGPAGISQGYFASGYAAGRGGPGSLNNLPNGSYVISATLVASWVPCPVVCIGPPHVSCTFFDSNRTMLVADEVEGANDRAYIPFTFAETFSSAPDNYMFFDCGSPDRPDYFDGAQVSLSAVAVNKLN